MGTEFRQLASRVSCFLSRVNVGAVSAPEGTILIDSGIDEDVGRRLLALASGKGMNICAIVNTHFHSDHFSANAIIASRTGAKVYAPEIEEIFLRHPELEPYYLWGTAAAPKEYRESKFLRGQASPVDGAFPEGKLSICGAELEAISLPGHSLNQMGILVDGVLFAGDSLFSGETFGKHRMLFCSDVTRALASLDRIAALPGIQFVVPSHGTVIPAEELPAAVAENRRALESASEAVLAQARGNSAEEILKGYADSEGLQMGSIQYILHLTTVKAHLTHLEGLGRITCSMDGNLLVWQHKN